MRWIVVLLAVACAKNPETKEEPMPAPAPTAAPAPTGGPAGIESGSGTTGTTGTPGMGGPAGVSTPGRAVAVLEPKSGSTTTGSVSFETVGEDVKVTIDVANAPEGDHGVHIHETGDCSAPDAATAGGHFNPGGTEHGDHDSKVKHPGDLGNVNVGKDGKGHKELTLKSIMLDQGPHKVSGLSVIVHTNKDDFSQPAGNSGGRIACGVIR